MLNIFARAPVSRALQPVGRRLARAGVSPDAVTLVGTAGSVLGAVFLLGTGHLFVGALVITFFVLFDMLDGALARARGTTSRFGAVLDSSCDRVADGAILGALAWWFAGRGDSRSLLLASLLCLVLGSLISYIKARAEGAGLRCDVGIAERTERLIIVLVGTGLAGLGVPYVLPAALWLLVALSTVTVLQRGLEVRRQASLATVATTPPPR
ncbi:MAG: CDP-alcohol phosphatidyltransferase family protein [Geodermatophilaceae bacterium]|nr:CDP-alcohol phosphatidyltransferase family protein [Geodermatophilaceae bacterium]